MKSNNIWQITYENKKSNFFKNCIFIEGLPGMGNVGKVAVDFIVEELDAKKVATLFSYTLPNSVFVTENNLVSLPTIELYHKKIKNKNFLFLTGDVQPVDDVSSYHFCEEVLTLLKKNNCKTIITTAGIGLQELPKKPKVYVVANKKSLQTEFSKQIKVKRNIHNSIGPIMVMGVSGLLLGVAKEKGLDGVGLLAETFNHPFYLGIKGAREIIKILNNKYSLGIDISNLTSEINRLEKETIKRSKEFLMSNKKTKVGLRKETSYIG